MANPLDTLLQKVRSNVTNTASRLFGQAQSFVQQNPTPAGFIGSRVQQPIQNTFNTLGNQFNTGAQNFLKPSIVSPLPDTRLQKTLDIGRNIIGQTGKQIIQEVPKIGASALRASPSIQLDQQIQGLNPSLQKSITNTRISDAYNLLKGYGLATSGLIGNAVGGLAGMGMNTVNNALQGKPLSQNYAESFGKGVVDNAAFGPINKLAGGVVSQVGKLPIKSVQRAMNIIKSLEEPIVKYGGMYPEQTSLQIAKRALGAGVKGSVEGVIYGSSRPLQNGETRQEAIKNDVLTFTAMSMITQGGKDITRERLKPLAQKIGIGFKDYWNYLKGDGWTELPNGNLRFDESLLASSTKLPEGKVDVTKGRLYDIVKKIRNNEIDPSGYKATNQTAIATGKIIDKDIFPDAKSIRTATEADAKEFGGIYGGRARVITLADGSRIITDATIYRSKIILDEFAVAPKDQNKGIGTKYISELKKIADELGYEIDVSRITGTSDPWWRKQLDPTGVNEYRTTRSYKHNVAQPPISSGRLGDVGKQVYHATSANFDEFRLPTKDNGLGQAKAVFFSETPEGTKYYQRGANSKVIEATIKPEAKIFDYRNPAHQKLLEDFVDKTVKNNPTWAQSFKNLLKTGDWGTIEKPEIQAYIKKLGFDGFVDRDMTGHDAIGITNLKVISKSKPNVAQPPISDINSKIDLERSINQNVQKIQKDFLDGKITIEQRKALAEREFARSTAQPPLTDISSTGEIGGVPPKMETLASGVKLPEGKARGFTQSVQEAPVVSKGVKAQVKGGYIPKRNEKLMGEAQALLQEGASIDLKNTQNIDQKITATMQEALNQQRKNPQLAANLYNNLAEKGTELGRGVQAFSLLNKMSPDAIALSAAGKIKAYNRTAVRKIPELTGDQVKLISKQVDVIKKLAEGSRERNIAVNNLSNTINDFIPSSFADKAIAVWKAGLLTSLRTSERNIFGNSVHGMVEAVKDLPASLADRLMAGVTGKRTLTPTFQGAGEMYSKKTGQQISDVLRLGYDASEDISKFDHKRITWANTPVQQALKKYTDIVFRSLGAQDKPFYNSAFKRSLYSQAGAEAINIGQEGNRQIIQKLVESPTDEMIKTAISDANVATFKDKNSASSIANAIKREMAKVKLGDVEVGKIASEVFMPFTGVPTSILGQIANYSPIGLLKGIINTGKVLAQDVPELQRQAAHEIGRGVIGTGIFGLGSYLASKGLITGQPKDATEQRQWDLENKPRNSILINGKWRSLNSVGPEAVVFLAGAKLNEEMQNPEGSIGGYAGTLGKDYLDQSFVTGIQQPVNAITDPARYGKSYVGNQMASVMPNIVKDVAKSQDDTQREANTVTDYAKLATPFVRNTLIEKRDSLGNVMKQEPTGLGAFFDLFNSKTPVDNAVVNELSRLQKEGQSATPSKLTPNQTILKQKVKLTFDQLNQLEKGVGEALKPRLESLVTSPNYQQLDDEQKAQAIDKVVQTTRSQYKNLNASSITSGASPTTLPQGEMIPIVNKNGNVTMIDTSFQPERPKLTGQAELDKKLLSSYYGDITQKTNDIVALYKAGKLSANDANTQIANLKALRGSGGKARVSMGKIRMPKLKKLKVYKMKKVKIKQIKLPKLSKLKATRV